MKKLLLMVTLLMFVTGFAQPRVKVYKPVLDRKKQTVANLPVKSPDVIKQGLDSIVASKTYKTVLLYDNKGFTTSEVYYNWDDFNNHWYGSSKIEYEYDAQGNETLYLSYTWDSEINDWTIFYKEESEYDEYDNLTAQICAAWANGELVMKFKNEFEYDPTGKVTVDQVLDWDFVNNDWINLYRGESSYNENGYLSVYIDHEWIDNQWVAYYKIEHTYENDKNILYIKYDRIDNEWFLTEKGESEYDIYGNKIYYVESLWTGDGWAISFQDKNEYTYDDYGNITLHIHHSSDWMTGELILISKNVYEYDDYGNTTMSESYGWDEYLNDWTGWSKYVYFFNSAGYLEWMVNYNYDEPNKFWVVSYKYEYEYDINGNSTLSNYFLWEIGNWVHYQKSEYIFDLTYSTSELVHPMYYYYENMLLETIDSYWDGTEWSATIATYYWSTKEIEEGISEHASHGVYITTYPNPVSNVLNVSIENSDILPDVKIYSIQGALLISKKDNRIDVSSLPSGIYVAVINGQGRKFVKQ